MNIVRVLLLATLISENAVAQLPTYKHLRVVYGLSSAQRIDVYISSRAGAPTIVGIHGGGWSNIGAYPQSYGSEDYLSELAPFFALGWTVMNVEYRGSETARSSRRSACGTGPYPST